MRTNTHTWKETIRCTCSFMYVINKIQTKHMHLTEARTTITLDVFIYIYTYVHKFHGTNTDKQMEGDSSLHRFLQVCYLKNNHNTNIYKRFDNSVLTRRFIRI